MKRERESVLILKITRRVRGPVERGLASIRISLACRVPGVAFFFWFSFEFFPSNSSTVLPWNFFLDHRIFTLLFFSFV